MTTKDLQPDEAIRQLLRKTTLELPSEDFTSRIMERIEAEPAPAKNWIIRYQWMILFASFAIAVTMIFFPIWTWFGIEFTPIQFILYYAAEGFRISSVWLGSALSSLGGMGKMMYLLPVSMAILLLVVLDQAFKKNRHSVSHA